MSMRAVATMLGGLLALTACANGRDAPTFLPTVTAATVSAAPITSPTPSPTPSPSPPPSPTPSPTPTPDLEEIELQVTGCPGGAVLEWTPTSDPAFHHYTALRGPDPEIDPAWPPIAPAVDWGDTYVTDRFITSAVDSSIIPTPTIWKYRVMAYDLANRPVAASPVRHARLHDVVDLGPLLIEPGSDPGSTAIDWRLFGGLNRCFSVYRVLIGPGSGPPTSTLTAVARQGTTDVVTTGLHSGQTYTIRIDAARTTTLGDFVVARSETATYTVP